MRHVSDNTE